MSALTYEIRVDHAEGTNIVSLDAATLDEAVMRAGLIWSAPERVVVLATIDRSPQKCLAFA
jgi:hypothetical protein